MPRMPRSASIDGIPPFNPKATCSQCGYDDIMTRWCPGGCKDILGDIRPIVGHLHRICKRCAFEWLEATIERNKGK